MYGVKDLSLVIGEVSKYTNGLKIDKPTNKVLIGESEGISALGIFLDDEKFNVVNQKLKLSKDCHFLGNNKLIWALANGATIDNVNVDARIYKMRDGDKVILFALGNLKGLNNTHFVNSLVQYE